ncbi:MAG: nodulation protein NfeD [Deltaproteobacteria bacterium]|nr:nodulation protein NfeD [Deltaproteobacteria bacterium]
MKRLPIIMLFLAVLLGMPASADTEAGSSLLGPVVMIDMFGPITPATNDFLKTSIARAESKRAKLLLVRLNTPGGILTSMQTMVEQILQSPVPVAVYVAPSGSGAISAGVFITLAGHVAAMAPGTTIGAAHPVTGEGQDVKGDLRAKVENFAVSLITAISEQRGRNVEWAKKAVMESIAITDREALELKVIDYIASDTEKLLEMLEGKSVTVKGVEVTLKGLKNSPTETFVMTFKQKVVNVLADPNIMILLGLGAMLGIGIELYNPGLILPGVVGVICLVLSLTSAQVLPINYGGVALLLLSLIFFIVEAMAPSFGIWGIAGMICLVLGSIYLVDMDLVWAVEGFTVDKTLVGSVGFGVGLILSLTAILALRAHARKVSTGSEGIVGEIGKAITDFVPQMSNRSVLMGKIQVMGEIWNAVLKEPLTTEPSEKGVRVGDSLRVKSFGQAMTLEVEKV